MKKIIFTLSLMFLIIGINAQEDCVSYTLMQDTIGVKSATFGVSLADFNGDGWLDVVTIDAYADIEIYFNNGDGTLDTMNYMTLGEDRWRFGVKAFDIDNDGDMDFVTAPQSSESYGMEIWQNDGNGNFTLKSDNLSNYSAGNEFAVGDLNNDGYLDILFPNSDKVGIFLNDGNGNFSDNGQDLQANDPEGATLFDADNDGDLDAVVYTGFVDLLFLNDGNGNFTQAQELAQDDTEGVGCADIDNDGDIDIVVAPNPGNIELWINDGLGTFTPGDTLFGANEFYHEIYLADQNFDGLPDIFTDANIWLNDPDTPGVFHIQETFNVSSHDFDIGDLNKDGFIDIYIGRFSSNYGDMVYWCDTPSIVDFDTTLCVGDSIFLQGEWQHEQGVFLENAGCMTLKRTHLYFYDSVNTNVTLNGNTLTAEASGVNYQWINCDTQNDISGATDQSFTPDSSGNYAVVITTDHFSDTSSCYSVNITNTTDLNDKISIFPNPNSGKFYIQINTKFENIELTISDISGKIILKQKLNSNSNSIDISNNSKGLYLLQIKADNFIINKKILKN